MKLKQQQPSQKERPEKPIPRTPSPNGKEALSADEAASGQGGGPNRRSARPHGGRASRDQGAKPEGAAVEAIPHTPARRRQGNALRRRTASRDQSRSQGRRESSPSREAVRTAAARTPAKAADQTDDLLNLTDGTQLRGASSQLPRAREKAARPEGAPENRYRKRQA